MLQPAAMPVRSRYSPPRLLDQAATSPGQDAAATLRRVVATGPSHLFRLEGETLIPTDLVRGPWDHGLQHGGAVCGALGWVMGRALAIQDLDDLGAATDRQSNPDRVEPQLCRLTTEILRPVPAEPLQFRASVVRRGRRSQVVEAELQSDGRPVARASSQWATPQPQAGDRSADRPVLSEWLRSGGDPAVPRRPTTATDPGAADIGYPRPGFNCDAFELRCLLGSTEEPGPGIVWARMRGPVVDGHEPTVADRLATVADLANAVGWDLSPNQAPMINPDLTMQLLRYPRGEWICLDAEGKATAAGIGMMETTLWDGDGRFGRVLSTMVESPVALAVDL